MNHGFVVQGRHIACRWCVMFMPLMVVVVRAVTAESLGKTETRFGQSWLFFLDVYHSEVAVEK